MSTFWVSLIYSFFMFIGGFVGGYFVGKADRHVQ